MNYRDCCNQCSNTRILDCCESSCNSRCGCGCDDCCENTTVTAKTRECSCVDSAQALCRCATQEITSCDE